MLSLFDSEAGSGSGALLVWGIFSRALSVTLAFVLVSFSWQLRSLAGARGLNPLVRALARYRRDFGWRAVWYFPTLFWLNASDVVLVALPAIGATCALLAARGGAATPYYMAGAWAALLSIDAGTQMMVYPWDSLVLEATFLALWLPGTRALSWADGQFDATSLAALSPPSPLLAFAFRFLLFRVLFGFGKLKFIGATWADRFYIRGFIMGQPMVSPFGWFAYHLLPETAWVFLVNSMFVAEIIMPFGLFFCGLPRLVAAMSIAGLMAGIQLTGNFGYFNLLTIVLCVPALHLDTALSLDFSAVIGEGTRNIVFAVLFFSYLLPVSALQFIMNSWINMSWTYWSGICAFFYDRLRLPVFLWWSQFYARVIREFGQFRFVSGYGVFPPASSPSQRWAICYEGSSDGKTWERYELQYYLSSTRTPPRFVAPYHPRLDHALFYESFGSSGSPITLLGHNHPYGYHTSINAYVRLQLLLLEGGDATRTVAPFFRHNPFPSPDAPPRYVRVVANRYLPVPIAHWWRTGEWWTEERMGYQHPTLSLESVAAARGKSAVQHKSEEDAWPLSDGAPAPENFWCEHTTWRARAGMSAHALSQTDVEDAFKFIAVVRQSAAAAVADFLAAQPPSQKTRAPAPPAQSASTTPVSVLHDACFVRLPLDATAAKAADRVRASANNSLGSISRDDANAVFVWSAIPGTIERVRSTYSSAELVRLRTIINCMTAPIQRACERVADRPVPTANELAAEAALQGGLGADVRASYTTLAPMLSGERPDSSAETGKRAGLPLKTDAGEPRFYFSGNDDAGEAGAMRTPLCWLSFAHDRLLTGGREAFEKTIEQLGCELRGRVCLSGSGDMLANMSLPRVWDALTDGGSATPAAVATELGTFLTMVFCYDQVSAFAVGTHRVASQARPPRERPAAQPAFLPAFIEFVPRLHAHPALRRAHAPHAALEVISEAQRAWMDTPSVPDWYLSEDYATWSTVKLGRKSV